MRSKYWWQGLLVLAVALLVVHPATPADKVLRIDRIQDKRAEVFKELVVKPWAEKNGVRIIHGSYNSDEQMIANVKAAPGEYDLAYMGGTGVYRAIQLGLLEPIRLENVPEFKKNVLEKFHRMKVDPGPATHQLADAPGIFLIVYAKDKFPEPPPESYAVLHDPKYKGKIALRDYAAYRVLMTAAYLGYDLDNLTNLTPQQVEKLFETIREQRTIVRTYWKSAAENRLLLANREVWLSDYWISPTLQQKGELNLGWFIPKEGGPIWFMGWVVAKGSKHRDLAESLLNYYFQGDVHMAYKRAVGSDPIILKDAVYDRKKFEADFPDLARIGALIAERGRDLDPKFIETAMEKWVERFEEIKIGRK